MGTDLLGVNSAISCDSFPVANTTEYAAEALQCGAEARDNAAIPKSKSGGLQNKGRRNQPRSRGPPKRAAKADKKKPRDPQKRNESSSSGSARQQETNSEEMEGKGSKFALDSSSKSRRSKKQNNNGKKHKSQRGARAQKASKKFGGASQANLNEGKTASTKKPYRQNSKPHKPKRQQATEAGS